MKERPILFSAAMVKAILAGMKTQTRRSVKKFDWFEGHLIHEAGEDILSSKDGGIQRRCPHGSTGDRLWVRENGWQRPERTPRMMRDGADTWEPYYYDADGLSEQDCDDFKRWGFKRRPSIHMPRWASRITLEIEDIRVQRLQDITEADAVAEGCPDSHLVDGVPMWTSAVESYGELWDAINGPGSWNKNPLVWKITFKRIKP